MHYFWQISLIRDTSRVSVTDCMHICDIWQSEFKHIRLEYTQLQGKTRLLLAVFIQSLNVIFTTQNAHTLAILKDGMRQTNREAGKGL